ncbi:MAG: hypothetical protein LBP40_05700 [Campylobacteraceae bacterium]|jgi:type I restriction enzyme M protein|nr:hypothetical protein [Campylobacteraceae bacterium]
MVKNKKQARATRVCFMPSDKNGILFVEKKFEFNFYGGFDISQKRKTIAAFHEAIIKSNPNLTVLEISSKSPSQTGIDLSAFHLQYDNGDGHYYTVENIYQSSKIFENGGPFMDLLHCSPSAAKRDERLKNSGSLIYFKFNDEIWELEPKSAFYDYIYLKALCQPQNKKLQEALLNFSVFTDIEFNQTKSINCQARSSAIFVSLSLQGLLNGALQNSDSFKAVYKQINFANSMLAAQYSLLK